MVRGLEIAPAEEETAALIAAQCRGRVIDQPWFGVLYVMALGAVLAGGLIGVPGGLARAELVGIFGAVIALVVGLFFLWRRARVRDWTLMHPYVRPPDTITHSQHGRTRFRVPFRVRARVSILDTGRRGGLDAQRPVHERTGAEQGIMHGQTGVAPDGIDLHSVLDITFATGSGNTVTVTNPGNQLAPSVPRPACRFTPATSATGQTLTYTATGLPVGPRTARASTSR